MIFGLFGRGEADFKRFASQAGLTEARRVAAAEFRDMGYGQAQKTSLELRIGFGLFVERVLREGLAA